MSENKTYEYDVFLSFTGADRELKNELKAHLTKSGLVCYDSDALCKGRFRDDFCQALDKSRVYLMILSDNLRNDPLITGKGMLTEVRRESAYACELEARNELNVVILCLSEFFRYENGFHDYNDILGWHFYTHTRGFSTIYGSVESDGTLDNKSLSEVERECKEFTEQRKAGSPVVSQAPRIEISREKLIEPSSFKGRDAEMEAAMEAFSSGNQMVVLSGLGGMGKTCLATAIAKKCSDDGLFVCPQIVRVQEVKGSQDNLATLLSCVSYEKSVYDGLSALSERERYERKMKALSELPENVMLVIDNFNSLTMHDLLRLKSKLKCRILITTRVRLEESDEYKIISVSSLPLISAREMFNATCGVEISEQDFQKLYDFVGGHTITLCISAKMIAAHGFSVDNLLSELTAQADSGAKVDFEHNDIDETDTVIGHLARLFSVSDFDEESKRILKNMSVLSDGAIFTDTLMTALALKNRNGVNALIKSGWLEERTGERSELFLHPVLSRTAARLLRPDEQSVSEIIEYLCALVEEAGDGITFKDAAKSANKLFYACFVIASSCGSLSKSLWERYVHYNSFIADATDTEEKAKEIQRVLKQESEKATVQAYSDMILIQQFPTKTEALDKYIENLENSSNDYKWVMRSLSLTFSHVCGVKKHDEFLRRALKKAVKAAILRRDDFALIDLVISWLMVEEKKVVFSTIKPYLAMRKKERVESGDLMMVELLLTYFEYLSAKSGRDYYDKIAQIMSYVSEEKVGKIVTMAFRHPFKQAKLKRLLKKAEKLPDDDPMKFYVRSSMVVGQKFVLEGKMDVKNLLVAAVALHKRKLDEGNTLSSAEKAASGILSLVSALPLMQVESDNQALLASVDMENISVEELSKLQVSTILSRMLNNRQAVSQGERVVKAIKLLRPEGHGDVISALNSHADLCLTFNENTKAITAYFEIYQSLKKFAPESVELVDTAQKLLKALACTPSMGIENSLLKEIYKIADGDEPYGSFKQQYNFYYYSLILANKLTQSSKFALATKDELFQKLLGEAVVATTRISEFDLNAQKWLIGTIENLVVKLVKINDYETAEGLLNALKNCYSSSHQSVRDISEVTLADLKAFKGFWSGSDEVATLQLEAIDKCLKRKIKLETASWKAYCAVWLVLSEKKFKEDEFIEDKLSLLMDFGKERIRILNLVDTVWDAKWRGELEKADAIEDEAEREKTLDYEKVKRKFAMQIVETMKKEHSKSFGLDAKRFYKIKSSSDFMVIALEWTLNEVWRNIFDELGWEY